jgi:polysaccharide biosynthesis/export protein
MRRRGFRSSHTASHVVVALLILLPTGLRVSAQELPQQIRMERRPGELDVPQTAVGTTSIPIRGPSDTEAQPPATERVGAEPIGPVSFALEGPLDPDKYICGRGDIFEFNLWGKQNLKLRVPVDAEGRTFLAKIGYVAVAGKTLTEARASIGAAVRRYYPGLNFGLSLLAPRTFQVHVTGFVNHPGVYVANPFDRVAGLLARAGGFTGSRRRIEIRRRGGTTEYADLVLYEGTGEPSCNPFLRDGDVVFVPFTTTSATIAGAVKRPGRYELVKTRDLAELVEVAGGYTPSATSLLPIRLLRRDAEEHAKETRIAFRSDAKAPPTLALKDEDRIFVPDVSELQQNILLIGPVTGASAADEVTTTRRFRFAQGSTVRTVLEEAGGVGASGDLKGGYIRKPDGRIVAVDLEALLMRRDFSVDRPVDVGDTIVVPQKRRGIAVQGSVMTPMIYPYNPQFRGGEYVAIAGGAKQNARAKSDYKVVTADGKVKGYSDLLLIEPGDTIVVPERTFSRAEVVQLVIGGAALLVSSASLIFLMTR